MIITNSLPSVFETEGIKYMGSKKLLIPSINSIIKDLPIKTVFDGFSGSTRVGQFFKNKEVSVISNDINIWSKVFGECYLLNTKPFSYFEPLIKELNSLKPKYGWFSKYYGGANNDGTSIQSDGLKRIWQIHVTEKLDALRSEIDLWYSTGRISSIDKSVLLTSLILALDRVDSTLGHQVSYLRIWSSRSYNDLVLFVPKFRLNNTVNRVFCQDTLSLTNDVDVDLSYFDPPYGSSNDKMPSSRVRYGQYYHLWKTIILNDNPQLIGKIQKRIDADVEGTFSIFEDYHKDTSGKFLAQTAIENLIINSNSKYVLFSYNSNSRVPIPNIIDFLIGSKLKFNTYKVDYKKNVMASMSSSKEWLNLEHKENYEILLLVHK